MKRACKAMDCDESFVPKFPRQEYHARECRERMAVRRLEETKAERALERARNATHKQYLPSTFFDGSKVVGVLTDIRFLMEEDRLAHSGNKFNVAARVRGLSGALEAGDREAVYGEAIALAAAAGSLACRTNGGALFKQRRRDHAAP